MRPGGHQGDQVVTQVIRWSPRKPGGHKGDQVIRLSPRWFSLTGLSRKQKVAEVMLRVEVLSFFTFGLLGFLERGTFKSRFFSPVQARLVPSKG